MLPAWVDLLAVISFALAIFYLALHLSMSKQDAASAIAKDARQLDYEAA